MNEEQSTLNDNPLLLTDGLPRFDLIRPEHVEPAVRQVLAEGEQSLAELEENVQPTWAGCLEPLEKLGWPLEYAWQPVKHLKGVKNSQALRDAYDAVLGDVVAFGLRVGQSRPVYDALKAMREDELWESLSEVQRRIVEIKIRDAELDGVGLQGKAKERFNDIERELSQLNADFSNHVLDATKVFSLTLKQPADVEGAPPSLLALAAQSHNRSLTGGEPQVTPESGPWRIGLELPLFVPFMEHSKRRDHRETLYRAFITRASHGEYDNSELISRILKLRKEKAELLGFETYADLSLARKMAPDVNAVKTMFETLRSASWRHGVQDQKDISTLAADSGQAESLERWDQAFWSERLREKRFDYTDEQLRPYFPMPRVLDGLFALVRRLFGVAVTPADGDAPVWHPDVRYFRMVDESGTPVASFYLDPYSRPEEKQGGAWMDDCLGRCRMDGRTRLPVAHLVCNGTPPVGGKPSLMTFREVETLFHEFGHGLQHMLTTVDHADAAGINGIEWDAVELASQFMENWCYHKPTLLGLTAHVETGDPLAEDLFEKIRAARTYRAGSNMLRQLTFGMIDIELHNTYDVSGDTPVFEVQRRIMEDTSVLPPIPEDRTLCAFSHIFAGGYAAGYYSYKWAEVLSADAFAAFEEADLDDEEAVKTTGRRFRDTVLALGGGRHPMDVYKDFRGREPDPEALLRHNGLLDGAGAM